MAPICAHPTRRLSKITLPKQFISSREEAFGALPYGNKIILSMYSGVHIGNTDLTKSLELNFLTESAAWQLLLN